MQAVTITQITAPELEALIESSVRKVLNSHLKDKNHEPDRWFNLNELLNYLPDKPAKATAYGWVHSGLIPYHKGGKKLRFLKSEIDSWLKQGRRKTGAELEQEATAYLKKKGGHR